jgi:hypothetical protein
MPFYDFLNQIRAAAQDPHRRWPDDDDECKGWRAFKAALYVPDLAARGWSERKARFWMAHPVGADTGEGRERSMASPARSVHGFPDILAEVHRGSVTPTTAVHLLEVGSGRRLGALRVGWLAASDEEREQHRREIAGGRRWPRGLRLWLGPGAETGEAAKICRLGGPQ